jgi:transcriptional regulator with XRE-family HTH domain
VSSRKSAENNATVLAIQRALAASGMSRETLAQRARMSISTLNKGLSSERPFSLLSKMKIEGALGIALVEEAPSPSRASTELGSYSRAVAREFEGGYLTLRPSFAGRGAISAYRTEISWNPAKARLEFSEHNRADRAFAQKGQVSLPQQTGCCYLVTNEQGQYRLALLRRTIAGELYGLLLGLSSARGGHLTPVAMPYALVPLNAIARPRFGTIAKGDEPHALYQSHLEKVVADEFARLVSI